MGIPISRLLLLFAPLALPALIPAQTAEAWLPVPAEELRLKDNPDIPGAEAMILYREIYTDDTKSVERHHVRIKIFTDRGKRHGDIEIPNVEKVYQVEDIRARVVQPDGTAVEFRGQIFDKVVVKSRRLRIQVKTFTLPGVQAGSILEYTWRARWRDKFPDVLRNPQQYLITSMFYIPTARWDLQQELFTRRARFSLRPLPKARLEWTMVRPLGKERPALQEDGTLLVEIQNVPGLDAEELMPPVGMLQSQIHVRYQIGWGEFWVDHSRRMGEELDRFIGKHKGIGKEAAQLVAPGDPLETKLRKLYARVQKIRNLSAEPQAQQKPPPANKDVEDVLNRSYAFWNEINFLFVALARSAGFKAHIVMLTTRDSALFLSSVPDASQLNAMVVQVDLPSGPIFLDPASPFCPYGLLPWEETAAAGIRLDAQASGQVMTSTPSAASETAVTERTANLKLLPTGSLEGQLRAVFTGQEALELRRAAVGKDEAGRRKALEEEVKSWFPAGSTVEMIATGEQETSEVPLRVECKIQIPNFADFQGRRVLFPLSIFYAHRPARFRHAHRIHPVYFPHAYQLADRITIDLPPGYEVESTPTARNVAAAFGSLETGITRGHRSVEFTRRMVMNGYYFRKESYADLKAFFEKVKTNDDERVVARSAPAQQGQ